MRKIISVILCFVMLLPLCACAGRQDCKLLEDADVADSVLSLYYFDGTTTTEKWIIGTKQAQKVVDEINDLKTRAVDRSMAKEISIPCYGLTVGGVRGPQRLAYKNGIWIKEDGSVYKAEYDLASLFENATDPDQNTYDSGDAFPNARFLGEFDKGFYEKVEDMPSEKDGVSLSFVDLKDNTVTVRIMNNSGGYFVHSEIFSLQKEIDGAWYRVPSDVSFTLPAIYLPSGGSEDQECPLDTYGELSKGRYRIEKEGLVAEFEIK